MPIDDATARSRLRAFLGAIGYGEGWILSIESGVAARKKLCLRDQWLPIATMFHLRKGSPDGHATECKACAAERKGRR